MPYIEQKRRIDLAEDLEAISRKIESCGELNYVITNLCINFLKRKGKNYQNINEVVGVLECAKLEFYRRLAGIYEDSKIISNGDVY